MIYSEIKKNLIFLNNYQEIIGVITNIDKTDSYLSISISCKKIFTLDVPLSYLKNINDIHDMEIDDSISILRIGTYYYVKINDETLTDNISIEKKEI